MKKIITAAVLSAVLVLSLAACGQSDGGSDETAAGGVKTARVVLETNNNPYTYQDEDGNMAGYDYEVLKLVDE